MTSPRPAGPQSVQIPIPPRKLLSGWNEGRDELTEGVRCGSELLPRQPQVGHHIQCNCCSGATTIVTREALRLAPAILKISRGGRSSHSHNSTRLVRSPMKKGRRIESLRPGSTSAFARTPQNSPTTSPPPMVINPASTLLLMFSLIERTEPSTIATLANPTWKL